jgi:hypothetical protein
MRDFLRFFAIQFVNYGVLCWNYRAVAGVHYAHIAASDVAAAALGFTIIRHVAKTDTKGAMLGYVAGGVCGSLVFTWLTTKVF